LSLAEAELVIAGNIDPYFRGQLVAALTPEDEIGGVLPDARARARLSRLRHALLKKPFAVDHAARTRPAVLFAFDGANFVTLVSTPSAVVVFVATTA
jgi:hypothetical protein